MKIKHLSISHEVGNVSQIADILEILDIKSFVSLKNHLKEGYGYISYKKRSDCRCSHCAMQDDTYISGLLVGSNTRITHEALVKLYR